MLEINRFIDHTLLKPDATREAIVQLCSQARQYDFFSVCINPGYVPLAARQLEGSQVQVYTVVGFPLGATSTASKVFEARQAVEEGATEIDMVLNLGLLKSGDLEALANDISQVKEAIGSKVLKVILETGYLSDQEIELASRIASSAKADFVKTSTGFGPRGASFHDIHLMKGAIGNDVKIKASGGIRDYETAIGYLELGVQRLGTSSGVAIMKEQSDFRK